MQWSVYHRLNLHVSASNLDLIRAVWRKIDRTKKQRDTRSMRHALYKLLIEHHEQSREVVKVWRL